MTSANALLLLKDIISILVGGLVDFGQGIGTALSKLVQSIFLVTTGEGASATTGLSMFGVLIIIFASVSLAVGLSRWAVNFLTSLGRRNR